MIVKLTGIILLALGSGCICAERIGKGRKEIELLYDLSGALESIEGIICWEKATLPQAIQRQITRKKCGGMFSMILNYVKSGDTLQNSWEKTFSELSSVSDILCRIELFGDETRITGQLHLAAQQLRKQAERHSNERPEKEKLCVAVCSSVLGVLTILLF